MRVKPGAHLFQNTSNDGFGLLSPKFCARLPATTSRETARTRAISKVPARGPLKTAHQPLMLGP
jgi:hypothetical protein